MSIELGNSEKDIIECNKAAFNVIWRQWNDIIGASLCFEVIHKRQEERFKNCLYNLWDAILIKDNSVSAMKLKKFTKDISDWIEMRYLGYLSLDTIPGNASKKNLKDVTQCIDNIERIVKIIRENSSYFFADADNSNDKEIKFKVTSCDGQSYRSNVVLNNPVIEEIFKLNILLPMVWDSPISGIYIIFKLFSKEISFQDEFDSTMGEKHKNRYRGIKSISKNLEKYLNIQIIKENNESTSKSLLDLGGIYKYCNSISSTQKHKLFTFLSERWNFLNFELNEKYNEEEQYFLVFYTILLAKLSDEELIQLRKFNIELQIILPFFMHYDFSMTKVDEFLAGLKAWNLISLQKKLVQEKESYWKINTHSWKLMQKTNYDSNQLGDKGIYYLVCWKILVYKYSNIFSSKFRYKCGVQMFLLMPNIQKFIVHLLNNNVMKMEDTWESIDLHLKEQIIGLFPEKNQKIAKQAFYCAKKIYIKLYPDDDKYYWKHFGTILCFIVISKQILIKNKARKKVSLDSLLKHMAHDNDANLNMKIQLLFEEIKYGLYGIRENLKSKISLKDNMLNYNFICAQSPEEVINNFLMVSRILFNDPLFMMFYGKVQIPIEQVKIRMRI